MERPTWQGTKRSLWPVAYEEPTTVDSEEVHKVYLIHGQNSMISDALQHNEKTIDPIVRKEVQIPTLS